MGKTKRIDRDIMHKEKGDSKICFQKNIGIKVVSKETENLREVGKQKIKA